MTRSKPARIESDLPKVQRRRLDNGLIQILHHDSGLPLVAVNLGYQVGSKDDPSGRSGLAHLIEHMLYQGSEHLPGEEYLRHVKRVGGLANASTSHDRTRVYQVVPAHQLELALWLEADRLGFLLPALTQDRLDVERRVVLNERRQQVDSGPFGRATEIVHELLYPEGHPYRTPVIGTPEDLERINLEEVRGFFRTHYCPSNAVLTIAGDFSADEASEWVDRYFGEIPSGDQKAGMAVVNPSEAKGALSAGRRLEIQAESQVARLYFAYHLPPYGTDAWYAADLLAHALASGKTGILTQDLVDQRRLALGIQAKVPAGQHGSSFWLMATGRPETDPETLERELDEWLISLAEKPLSEDTVERAKNWVINHHWHENQLLAERADRLCRSASFFGEPESIASEIERYRSLSSQDLQGVARDFLAASQRATLKISPTSIK